MTDPDRDIRVDVRLKRAIESGTLPKETLICGPAGTGKTFSILAFLHLIAADYRNVRILFVRKTRRSLTESVCVTYEQEILPRDSMEYLAAGASRSHRSSYRYPSGSEIVLRGLDDPEGIGSTAWDIVFANEAIELSEGPYETIRSRLNRPGRDRRFAYLIGDTNPGDPSLWLKKRCDDGRTKLWDTTHKANIAMWDGRDWTDAGRDYIQNSLEPLRGTRRKRLLEGIWAAGEGTWFETFGDDHVSAERAEFDPSYPVHLAVDSGVHTGGVWFQVREGHAGPIVTVFADYYTFSRPAFENAEAVKRATETLCGGRWDRGVTDPAGRASTGAGPTVFGEYARAGLKLDCWPSFPGSVTDGLSLLESFVATDPPALYVHPRCVHLIQAFANYKRAKRGGQYIDRPEDPQHPHEELMDALRGGLQDKFPDGRRPKPSFPRRPIRQVF